MYAIVEIAGQQFKVERGNKVYVHRLDASEGAKLEFGNVLLIDNGGSVQVGTPSVEGAKVAVTVLSHLKGDKVIVFKKKRRKGYQKSNGHRQQLTQILVQGILGKGETLKDEIKFEKKAPVAKAEKAEVAEVKEPKKAAPKKAAAKKEAAPAKEKAAPKKAAKKAAKKSEE
jgi:large subunit ribosomal protein L21